jgi:hypothetical protein
MAEIESEYIDPYEPGTRRERGYMAGIASIYQDDYIENAATIAANVIKRSVIHEVEVHIQDTEFDIDELVI